MKIVIDTREQRPFPFTDARYADTQTEQGTLQCGDYSLAGLEDRVAVERKSLPDLIACLGRERPRFVRELQRARALESFCVVCEGSWSELITGRYKSLLKPAAAFQSVAAFASRLRVPFFFTGSRSGAEYLTYSLLRQYLEGKKHEMKAVSALLEQRRT